MCGLVRMHCWRERDQFRLLDVPRNDAAKVAKAMRAEGWHITYSVVL